VKWSDTQIWKELEKRKGVEEEAVQTFLKGFLPNIETVLTSGGTSPSDFTLHDADHAFCVAKRMGEIAGDILSELSIYELALLLLSAYLHDIGMTPEKGKVNNHYNYLLTGDKKGLSDNDIEALSRWLDDEEKGVTIPISSKPVTVKDIELATELTTYYCRERHNDWSGEWIEKNQHSDDLSGYNGFRHDLIKLCQSHHYGREELETNNFNARIIGQQGKVVNLRYLACVLRIADILEFDPERTPEVILRHRDISEKSLIYWYKDHEIAFTMEGNNRLVLSARPTNAIIHKAIEDTCDQIDNELRLCRMLAESMPFDACPGLEKKQPHKWMLAHAVHRDVKPRDNTYEYIDGAFRPNTQKILEILSGIELYGEALTSIRELLQNAFDAVCEQIAYERLENRYPKDNKLAESLTKLHRVELRLEKRRGEFWLVCSDTGVGMNKRIICNHLLISGQPRRHDILNLERKCLEAGFNLGRTGKFGIGVLSYFMIADRLVISTRRSLEPKDGDSNGWIFETRGIGAFGELRKDESILHGSRIEMCLRKEIIGDEVKEWYRKLREYLVLLLRLVPCGFQLNSAIPECEPLDIKPGWKDDIDEIKEIAANGFGGNDNDDRNKYVDENLLPKDIRNEQIAKVNRIEEIRRKISQCLRWICEEGELPDRIGRFRIRMPYFELAGGASLVFMDDDKYGDELKVKELLKERGFFYRPRFDTFASWKGMRIHLGSYVIDRSYCIKLEFDFYDEEAGTPQVSRNIISVKPKGERALLWLNKKAKDLEDKFVKENVKSRYSLLNCGIAGVHVSIKDPQWLVLDDKKTDEVKFQRIEFPATITFPWKYLTLPQKIRYRGNAVTLLTLFVTRTGTYRYEEVSGIDLSRTCPDKIVLANNIYWLSVAPLWDKSPYNTDGQDIGTIKAASFPPKWKGVTGIMFGRKGELVWNKVFPPLKHIKKDDLNWSKKQTDKIDPLAISDILLKDRGRATAWVLNFVCSGNKNVWNALLERAPGFLNEVWRIIFNLSVKSLIFKPIALWIDDTTDSRLILLSPSGWNEYKDSSEDKKIIEQYMPDPGEDWKLVYVEEKTEQSKENKVANRGKRSKGKIKGTVTKK
jgi:hypothetical protein